MNDLLFKICSAIATAEGFFVPNSLPARLHNPGDLRAAPWRPMAKAEKGFWKADSDAEGVAGLYHQVALDIARGLNLEQLISKWAPKSDGNNTENYIVETMRRTGITDRHAPLWSLLQIVKIP